MIFLYMLRKQISIHKYASFLLLCGVVVCIYCISVMFGVSNGLYELENSHNINATITVDVGAETKNNIDKINEYVSKMSKKGVLNVIYFTRVLLREAFLMRRCRKMHKMWLLFLTVGEQNIIKMK